MACLSLTGTVHADERRESDSPFKIEDFAPKKGRYTLSAGLGYAVSDSKNVNISSVIIPVTHNYALILPDVTLDDRRRDRFFTHMGLRYALRNGLNASLGIRADASRSVIRGNNNVTRTEHDAGWRQLTAGIDYRLSSPFDQPYVLAFADVALAEKNGDETLHGKTAAVGLGAHWAFDPVILSLSGSYSYLGVRSSSSGKTYDPGDIVGLSGSFGIAVNPEITFRAGFAQSFSSGDKVNGRKGAWKSSSAFTFGYSHRLSPRLVMNIDAQAGIAGNDTGQISAGFTWRP